MQILASILGPVMAWCYTVVKNYGWAIVLFTLLSKLILLPVSVWVHKNSIKMVKMQPEINQMKIDHYGDKDTIAEEEQKLYKKNKYNPLVSLVPLTLQIILLMGVVAVIYRPLTYVLKIPEPVISEYTKITLENVEGLNPESNSLQLHVIEDIQSGEHDVLYTSVSDDPQYAASLNEIKNFNLKFAGFNLSWTTSLMGGITWLVPIIAGLSSMLLSIIQNKINVLQSAQGNMNKYGMLIFSTCLSLYLGAFVPAGVALYWVASNMFAILQVLVLNTVINPKKYVDYEKLEETKTELARLDAMSKKSKRKRNDPLSIREREDYKRFFSVGNKHLVFYSESNGFFKYFEDMINYILENTDIPIHYITSDPYDNIFKLAEKNSQILPYFIEEKKLITLMMKLEADVVVMTMPDLENYHIKRSYIRKDIEYIFISHGMGSNNLTQRTGSMDHFDTVMVTGRNQKEEIEQTEEVYQLPKKTIVEVGYPLLDRMIVSYQEFLKQKEATDVKNVLIAPSWQKDNIVDSCLDELLDALKGHDYNIIVRPHPQHVRHMPEKMEALKEKFADDPTVEIQTDFSKTSTIYEADMMITDWSGVATEYLFTTLRPVLYIDTPMKVMNPEYNRIKAVPFNIWIRNEAGKVLKLDEIDKANDYVEYLLNNAPAYAEKIKSIRDNMIYNVGCSAEAGARYIITEVFKKIAERNNTESPLGEYRNQAVSLSESARTGEQNAA